MVRVCCVFRATAERFACRLVDFGSSRAAYLRTIYFWLGAGKRHSSPQRVFGKEQRRAPHVSRGWVFQVALRAGHASCYPYGVSCSSMHHEPDVSVLLTCCQFLKVFRSHQGAFHIQYSANLLKIHEAESHIRGSEMIFVAPESGD